MSPKWSVIFMTLFTVFGLTDSSLRRDKRTHDLLYSHYKSAAHCDAGGLLIAHGEVFTDTTNSRCLQHQCFLGTAFILSEGCEDGSGECHDVEDTWEERCITYICTKTTIGGYDYFQPIIQDARCRDVNGICHDPGENFSYRLNGRLHHTCRCNVTDNRIYYKCY